MSEFLLGLFIWTCVQMGLNPDKTPPPKFVMVTPIEMALLSCGSPVNCEISVAEPDPQANAIFVIIPDEDNRIKYSDRRIASVIVHNLVHLIQYHKTGRDVEKMKKYWSHYEEEALELQKRYITSVDI